MDNVCIICREEMVTGAKRLPCNHIFHTRWERPRGAWASGVALGGRTPGTCQPLPGLDPQLPALLVPAAADLPHLPYGRPSGIIADPVTAAP